MQVDKYFSCLLGNAVPNDDISVTSQQRFVSGVVCQLVCRLAVDIFEYDFLSRIVHMQTCWLI